MSKKEVLREYKKKYYGFFDIELIDNRVIFQNDLNVLLDIKFKTIAEKNYIYSCLIKLLDVFDFSFTLEYGSLANLEVCSILN